MTIYRILSALLSYPQAELLAALPEIELALAATPDSAAALAPLLDYLAHTGLITLQENYVANFDRTPSLALHLFEHIHGESRDRGQAMVDLIDEYRRHGFEPEVSELPDFVPLFLEFLSLVDSVAAVKLLGEAIHVLAAIGVRLQRRENPYANLFLLLTSFTDVVPQEQGEPPVRDMDDAMETFGPGADGVEPLLRPGGPQTVNFYPQRPPTAMSGSCH
ncbi:MULTISPECIES: nitrate reductase molybdenum cofactor assembly chaperone [unclassified Undibacterium]|uniref:nitrate reductase molybdenum cofactor assembly chaperone n=1 Tax=unclassified Undibacterium TaxID=2630295 RepID=UPI002AC8EABA|nr:MULTISPECIES: nitrate reductase molybdenum cofactor assembly chaperone [unclassified Undibacterium]MEB0138093.1 nitrate reductase molybdenum cofactor assembly chaperone [Undibacterium sp. CCC2.1]MEB0171169.1 nitrate reductase molybdenum cofactor assembly chaperone [Undibacterium sp. CCC1.1]MEB0175214.1 nitrate reductase molybdenum cofactor assembly chaperone [Undibacterium sp. CCC3.4]MEB0214622.1 nitrate reductase molybdenum cofactor assembly chaperone [Undibacterium sp. 5I2]WPX42390.1 nitr